MDITSREVTYRSAVEQIFRDIRKTYFGAPPCPEKFI